MECKTELAAAEKRYTDAKNRRLIGPIVAGVGLAAAAVGAVLLYLAPSADELAARAPLVPVATVTSAGGTFGVSGRF